MPWILCFFFLLSIKQQSQAQNTQQLQEKISGVASEGQNTIGVAISNKSGTTPVYFNKKRHFVMQSVFKLPIALYALHQVDQGHLSLDQKIQITKEKLLPNTWSPIRKAYPSGTTMSLKRLIQYTVAQSDNNGCDILLDLIGGPRKVEKYLHHLGIKGISIKVNEATMHTDEKAQYKNWITPEASNKMLRIFYFNDNHLLSSKSYDFIWGVLKGTKTGTEKLKGALPQNTIVAHKTGHSGKNQKGITAAENDIGVIFLPNGHPLFVSVYITQSKENLSSDEKTIAQIAKTAWDFYQSGPQTSNDHH